MSLDFFVTHVPGYSMLAEAIRFWIPKIPLQSQPGENLAHLLRLRTPGILLQAARIPGCRQRPELLYRYQRPHRITLRRAPLPNPFFRPEEEHGASGEDDVIPPLRRRHQAVEKPRRRFGPFEAHGQTQGLCGLLAPGVHPARSVERCRYAKGVPGAVGEVLLAVND